MNKKNGECETKPCSYSAERTQFYHGMLLTDEHLRTEQTYHRDGLKRLTRYVLGSGIVCGLKVEWLTGFCIKVHPGVAVDCCGNLIEVCNCITLNFAKECEKEFGEECLPPKTRDPIKKYLVLRYVERGENPEPVLTPLDDCTSRDEKPKCQHSKMREGYCIELWDDCPCPEPQEPERSVREILTDRRKQLEQDEMDRPQKAQLSGQQQQQRGNYSVDVPAPCFPCGCCESAVGLAYIEIDCVNHKLTVDQTKCARYVFTPGLLRWVVSNTFTKYKSEEMLLLYPRMVDKSMANLVSALDEMTVSSENVRKLGKEIEELKNRQGVEMQQLRDVELKGFVDTEKKRVEAEAKARDAENKKIRDEIKRVTDYMGKLEKELDTLSKKP